MVPPATITVAVESLTLSVPVNALFPPPNTEHVFNTEQDSVPIVVPSLITIYVSPYTVAVWPFPPANALFSITAFFIAMRSF